MNGKKTIVLGASTNPQRYAYKATERLKNKGHHVIPVGIKEGEIFDLPIITDKRLFEDVDTITLYIGPKNQTDWFQYIVSTQPKRVIFNPGTENKDMKKLLSDNDIAYEEGCTLVMLQSGQY